MTRRVAVFAVVWAYIANAFWIPGGLDGGYWLSVLFPAPYYLLIGSSLGWLYVAFTRRWSHWLTVAVLTLLLIEWALWLFAGQLPSIYLGLTFTLATIGASYITRRLRVSPRNYSLSSKAKWQVCLFGLLLLLASLPNPGFFRAKPSVSPNGAFAARCFAGNDLIEPDDYLVYVGPGRLPLRWFGYCLPESMCSPAKNLHWISSQVLAGDSPDAYHSYLGQFYNVHIEIQSHP